MFATYFDDGFFEIAPRLAPHHDAYLDAFLNTRHCHRAAHLLQTCADPVRVAAGLPLGPGGAFYVGSAYGKKDGIYEGNRLLGAPPKLSVVGAPRATLAAFARVHGIHRERLADMTAGVQPSYWVPFELIDGADDDEVSYLLPVDTDRGTIYPEDVAPWLTYLALHFLWPWGYTLSGRLAYASEVRPTAGAELFACIEHGISVKNRRRGPSLRKRYEALVREEKEARSCDPFPLERAPSERYIERAPKDPHG